VTERPILFSAGMIRAILAGAKTLTRRVSPSQGIPVVEDDRVYIARGGGTPEIYAEPGDTLWVREAWRTPQSFDAMNAGEMARSCADAGYSRTWAPIQYEADDARCNWNHRDGADEPPGRYRHARYMPRWASRITLRVLEVRVERLQAITEADARAEGVVPLQMDAGSFLPAFEGLWDSINSKREGCAWEDDPLVWVVRFEARRG